MEFLDKIASKLTSKGIYSSLIECDEHTFTCIKQMIMDFIDDNHSMNKTNLSHTTHNSPEALMLVYRGITFSFISKEY